MMPSLHDFPLFQRFPTLWEPFIPTVKVHYAAKDSSVAYHGDAAQTVWLVLSGWVSLSRHTPDGKQVTVGLCTSGDLFGEAALFTHANYPYTAQILQDGTVLAAIPAATLRHLSSSDHAFSSFLMEMLNERIARVQLKLEHMSSLSASQRLGCFLLRLCGQREDDGSVVMPIDKHVVASYLGMKPETLSRSFQQLSPLGIEVKHATITVADVSKLQAFVCGSCAESGMCETETDATELKA